MVHELDEIVLRSENIPKLSCGLQGLVVLPQSQTCLHFAARTPGGGDDSGGVRLEKIPIHSRFEVVALQRCQRRHAEKVVHTFGVFRQQSEVGVGASTGNIVLSPGTPLNPSLITPRGSWGEVRLNTDDGVDPRSSRFLPELVGAKHDPVVGHGDRGHLLSSYLINQVRNFGRTIQHRILGVHVKVRKRVVGRAHKRLLGGRESLE